MDRFYSPRWMASALCEPFELPPGARVFDPTMGEGALLLAADENCKSPLNQLMGCDLDAQVVKAARANYPNWTVGRADIFSASSRNSSPVWRSVKRTGVDLVVLNPPFSYRGKKRKPVHYFGTTYHATPAVAALAIVLSEVKTTQGVGVVLPEGSFRGEVNEEVWQGIRAHFNVSVVRRLPRGSFPDAKASSVLLAVQPRLEGQLRPLAVPSSNASVGTYSSVCRCVEVIRGRVYNNQPWNQSSDGVPFVHTTNLINGEIAGIDRFQSPALATRGPLVLVPRVGRFYPHKVVLTDTTEVVLSDCLIALRTRDRASLQALRSIMLHPAMGLERRYSGTGAPYITVRDVVAMIASAGLTPQHVPADQTTFECRCQADLVSSRSVS